MKSIFFISLPVPTRSLSLSRSVVPTLSRSVVPTWLCRPSTISLYAPPVCSPNKRPETKIFASSSPTDDGANAEEEFWITGLDDPLLAEVVTKKRKYMSAMFANLSVDAAIRKLGAKVAEKDPLWASLVAESKLEAKLRFEYQESKVRYVFQRAENGTSYEDVEENLYRTILALEEYGQVYTKVVAEWLIKYGFRLLELEEDEDFTDVVNPCTRKETLALGESDMRNLKRGDIIQLERKGYYRCDVPLIRSSKPIVLFAIPDGKQQTMTK